MRWFWNEKVEDVCEPVDETVEVDLDRLREAAKAHILNMLGAPVIKLELDEAQIDHAINYTIELIDYVGFENEEQYSVLLKAGSLAFAKYMLGRIRVKFASLPESPADGFALVNEANRDIEAFYIRLGID